ncbi:FxsB family radical SAM/SPASM domain protein [Streptomyces sp. ME02-8801-2C]|uniref:FxsB family cyclophane-forming radical SAM/SPASM peptide maturase n=1 Tax=Streptomyces sp. ME02-8801-2C TaxID=3028680 RepID=UPI0029B63DA2|nr:FxsB family cyclophane-forming radical SAM/SPASM peptide maturase [Streptomyces sp. ME02-8801-2C]MDX3451041.1 FxsB family radical SAM/SPASM domain protein [Streptomyces sp. ME02-8801-2C]
MTSYPWPVQGLDVNAIRRATGARPTPFQQFVLKVHSRCNLACTYCYVYEGPDQSWRGRPRAVSAEVVDAAAARIAEHAAAHQLRDVHVNLHGGEPLLSGPGPLVRHAEAVRRAVAEQAGTSCRVHVTTQTNGTLLTDAVVGELADAGIRIGVSLDGGLARHNSRRIDRRGRPAWPAATRGLRVLARHPDAYAGILCTIDPAMDPVEVYESLLEYAPPSLDLLLPHANWAAPPSGAETPGTYGRWLAAVFDHWFDAEHMRTTIRLFTEIVGLLMGLPSGTEAVGTSPVVAVVIDTDGAVEQVDSLKTTYAGAPVTGFNVFRHAFDLVLDHPGIVARQIGLAALSSTCRSCAVVEVCGGGNYAHRFRADSGFLNPSVYCPDLAHLIRHIAGRLSAAVGDARLREG